MAAVMKKITVFCLFLTGLSALLWKITQAGFWLSLTIAAGTAEYHFLMRLGIGSLFSRLPGSWRDHRKAWYRPRDFEPGLYRMLKVRRWKNRLPTYDSQAFDLRLHSLEEIVAETCQAEVIHEVIALFSFLPLFAIPWLGAPWVFCITSLIAAGFDLTFVILQRYNRPRLLRVLNRKSRP